jgi:antirestriction protein ArdC
MCAMQPISKERKPMAPKDGNTESRFDRKDVYTRVTDRIIADLEQGVRTWMKPWSAEHAAGRISRPLRHNGMAYRGMNVLLLWGEAMAKGYAAPIWMTFKQALELDAHVRKGEHGSLVVYANSISRTETNDKGEDVERSIPFMRGYTVFNVEQIEGLPAHYYAKPENPLPLSERIESADQFLTATGATIRHGGNSAFYAPGRDLVQMPPFEAFRDKESYYATALHELTHWSGAKHRLDRSFDAKRFGDHGYAREELVAELGAAFLCADLGITPEIRDDHAAYLGHWLNVLKEDKRAIFSAAAHAQRAADFLHGLQPRSEEGAAEPEPEAAAA